MRQESPRGRRRRLTRAYSERQLAAWLSFGYKPLALGRLAKGVGLGCRCHRSAPGCPKVPASLCHGWLSDYHPSVRQRIDGKRLCRAWLIELRPNRSGHRRPADRVDL